MDAQAVLGILGLAAATFSTLWATGGWSALRRRSIQQELDLAKELPPSSTARARLTEHAEQRIAIYLYRIQKQPTKVGRPASIFVLGFIIAAVIRALFPDAPIFVIYVVEGFLAVALFWTYAVVLRSLWIRWSRRHHDQLLQEALRVAPTAGAAEGQGAEHG